MKINNGDKFVATKKLWFIDEGVVITVTDVSEDNIISFAFGENSTGYMDSVTFEKYFEKVEPENPENLEEYDEIVVEITDEYIDEIMQDSEFEIRTVCDKCAVVSCKLPNGFVIVESAYCPDAEDYDEDVYADICFDKIAVKIVELETYRIQENAHRGMYDDCDECHCDEDEDDDFIEPDCEGCTDYGCEYNPYNSTTTKYPVS